MKRFVLLLLLFPIMALGATPAQQLSQLLSGFSSMQADFVQTVKDQKASGNMALMRPDKFRWHTLKPNKQIIIVDGKNVWLYDVDLEQVMKQRLDTKYNVNPVALLGGSIAELKGNFIVTIMKKKQPGQWFTIKPKDPMGMFQQIQFQFVNSQLKSMHIVDNMGTQSSIVFSNVKINPQLDSALFKLKIPADVDVVDNTKKVEIKCDAKTGLCLIPVDEVQ